MDVKELTFSESIALGSLKRIGLKTAEELAEVIGWEPEKAETVLQQLVGRELVTIRHIKKYVIDTIEDHTGMQHKVRDTKFVTAYQPTTKAFKLP